MEVVWEPVIFTLYIMLVLGERSMTVQNPSHKYIKKSLCIASLGSVTSIVKTWYPLKGLATMWF